MINVERKNNLFLAMIVTLIKFSLGFISYPLYFHYLNSIEISVFFLFISTNSVIELLDFGFAGSITRYFAYASSKPQQYSINILLKISKIYYRWLCLIAFIVIIIGFSIYLYFFTRIHHVAYLSYVLIWLVYGVSVLIGVYFMYFSPLLIGFGFIDQVNKIALISRLTGLFCQVVLLINGFGLFAIAGGAICSTLVERVMLLKILDKLNFKNSKSVQINEIRQTFREIWSVNYKLGLTSLAWLFIAKINIFVAGVAIKNVTILAEYLLTFQVMTIVFSFAHVPLSNNFGDISAYYVSDKLRAVSLFLESNKRSIWLMLLFSSGLLFLGNSLLQLLHIGHRLLDRPYLFTILLIYIFEKQLINHSTMISIRNEVPMLKGYLFTGVFVFLLTIAFIFVLKLEVWSVILPQLLAQSCFNYWYWVKYNLDKENISLHRYFTGFFSGSV